MGLTTGQRLGPYEVTATLGAGGMGEVYRARDTKLDRDVALKILPEAVAADPDRLMRFEREAKTLASINHPHIAQIYNVEEGAPSFLIMELVEGEDLAQRLARGPLPLDDVLPIARQIADALEAAHEAGIIHRDLKPANIRVRPDGTVKVLDFGLAKDGRAAGAAAGAVLNSPTITSPAMTAAGMILGTAAYMSPEQAKGKPLDTRSDTWAFGCVLYEMLTGRRAFDGEDVTDTIVAVVSKEVDWSALPHTTPAGIRRLLARCLAKDPRRRLRHIGDAQHELTDDPSLLPGAPVAATAPAPRFTRTATAAALGVCMLLAVPAFLHWRETVPSGRPLRLTIDAPPNAARLLSPEISPDGRAVAFASLAAGRRGPDLWIRRLGDAAPAMVPNAPQPNGMAFWSPDGRTLAYPSESTLVHMDLASSTSRTLASFTATLAALARFQGTWSAEGVILFGLGSTIFRLPEGGGVPEPLTFDGLAPESDNRFPVFLPDGRRFFFLSSAPGGDPYTYLASLDGGPVTRLFAAESQAVYTEPAPGRGYVLFVREGNLLAQPFDLRAARPRGASFVVAPAVPIYAAEFVGTGRGAFSVSHDGVLVYISQPDTAVQRLTWFDRQGKELGTWGTPALYFGPRIAPDGRRVAVAKLDPRTRLGDIYIVEDGGGEQRLTFDPGNDIQPIWDPRGEYVIWASYRNGKSQLYRKRADGGGAEELLHESAYSLAPDDVSPDGRLVVFRESHPVTSNDLWVLPLDGSGPARPILSTPADEPRARFSPDGRLLSYLSDESGRNQAYVQTFPGLDAKWEVTSGGATVPQWREDGKEIYYAGSSLWARAVVSTAPLRLGEPAALFTPPTVPRGSFFHASPDGQQFLFAVDPVQAATLRYQVAIDWAPR